MNEVAELRNIIRQTFHKTSPCLGVAEKDVLDKGDNGDGMVAELPFRRIISKYCEMAIKAEVWNMFANSRDSSSLSFFLSGF